MSVASPPVVAAVPVRRRLLPLVLWVGIALLGACVLMALVSVFWTPFPLEDTTGGRLEGPSATHWLGTDKLGRDTASFVLVGTRIALVVGFGAALVAMLVGVVAGTVAGFAGGWLDDIASSLLDVLIAFPTLLLAMLIGAARGGGLATAVVSIGLAASAVVARLTRILVKRLLQQPFVTAARTSGLRWPGIILRHLLPNMWPTLVVAAALVFGSAVLAEASLSFLGLGVPPPNSSLGRLLQQAQDTMLSAPLAAIVPGLVLVAIVLGGNFIADGLRERFDPTRRGF